MSIGIDFTTLTFDLVKIITMFSLTYYARSSVFGLLRLLQHTADG